MLDGRQFQTWFVEAMRAERNPADMPLAFAVYRNTWLQGLIDALGSNYPTIGMLLGDQSFEAVALEFARGHPAETPVLALYGEQFSDFLRAHDLSREIPYLSDVAQLERLWTECFFAPDAPVLEEQDYASLTPSQLVKLNARFHPATRIGRFATPAVTIWQAHRTGDAVEGLEPQWKPEHALVTRKGGIAVMPIDQPTFHMLAAIRDGRSLGAAITATAQAHPRADLAGGLTTIISSAALTVTFLEDD